MEKSRKEQIALLLLKQQLREKGLWLAPKKIRSEEFKRYADSIGVPVDEAMEFAESIVRELVDEIFKSQ